MISRALLAAVIIAAPHALALSAQAPSELRFEVASVRRVEVAPTAIGVPVYPITGGVGTNEPLRKTYRATWLVNLIVEAFGVPSEQISGRPDWFSKERYDVVANIPEGATKEQFNIMLGNLLRDRFHLKLHMESRDQPVYALRVAKSGHKLKATARRADETTPSGVAAPDAEGFLVLPPNYQGIMARPTVGEMFSTGQDVSIADVARLAQREAARPVVDETGLTGRYDFRLHFEWGRPGAAQTALSAPSIFLALEQQLGLKLEPSTASLPHLVIDSLEREPTEN